MKAFRVSDLSPASRGALYRYEKAVRELQEAQNSLFDKEVIPYREAYRKAKRVIVSRLRRLEDAQVSDSRGWPRKETQRSVEFPQES